MKRDSRGPDCAGGKKLFALIGIGLPAFRIAGGALLLLISIEMLFERKLDRQQQTASTAAEHLHNTTSTPPSPSTARATVCASATAKQHQDAGFRGDHPHRLEVGPIAESTGALGTFPEYRALDITGLAVFPLAIPMCAGPGSVTSLLMLLEEVRARIG